MKIAVYPGSFDPVTLGQMAQTNRVIAPEIDTIFLTTNLKYSYLSSSIVKEIAEYDGDISGFLHPATARRVREKLEEIKKVQG